MISEDFSNKQLLLKKEGKASPVPDKEVKRELANDVRKGIFERAKGLLLSLVLPLKKLRQPILAFWDKYIQRYGEAVHKGYKSNALAPLVWFDVFVIPITAILIYITKNEILQIILICLFVLIVLFTLIMYSILVFKDPKLLQSEKFRIEDKKLELIAQKGTGFNVESVKLTQIGSEDQHE